MGDEFERDEPVSRRSLLKAGGVTVSLAALMAACGGDEEEVAPGRVGFAPVPSTPVDEEVNDGTYLRTAASMELALVDMYGQLTELGALDGADQEMFDRMASDHVVNAATVNALASTVGAEAYECPNAWYLDRYIGPALEHVEGDPEAEIPPSDDMARDSLRVANTFETTIAAMYQQMIARLHSRELRMAVAPLAAQAARHAAAIALAAGEAPAIYVSPATSGGEVVPDAAGFPPLYAIPTTFGSVAATELVIGARNEGGLRYVLPVDTPAPNSYIFPSDTCQT